MTAEFRLTGRHVLAFMLAFFFAVAAANAVFIALAVRSFPGETERKSYLQGLRYNDVLASRAAQAALGWRAAIEEVARAEGGVRILVSFAGAGGAPLRGLDVGGALLRPASAEGARDLAFVPRGSGRYEAMVEAPQGVYDLTVRAVGGAGESFEFSNRIDLP